MRTGVLFVYAFVLSVLGGCTVIQAAFGIFHGDIDYVAAHAITPLLACVSLWILGLCFWLGSEPRALDQASLLMAGFLLLLCLTGLGTDVQGRGAALAVRDSLPLSASVMTGWGLMIAIQWGLVRRCFQTSAAPERAPRTDSDRFTGPYSH